MQFRKIVVLILALTGAVFFTGCFGGDSDDKGTTLPASYVTLSGTLTAPDKIEETLLGNTLNNVDSEVRSSFKKAVVSVNGTQISTFEILDMASNADWPFTIENVPESSVGTYEVAVVVGHITLRAKVRDSEKSQFRINLETTAAAMLADVTTFEPYQLQTTYLAFVNSLKNALAASAQKTATDLAAGSIVNDAGVQTVMNTQKGFLESIADLTTTAKFAYLQLENDLDGDGKIDLYVKPNASGQRVSFYTPLTASTTMLEGAASLDAYADNALLADFADQAKLSQDRTFAAGSPQTILGLYFKKSASGDQYLKMFIHRVDITDGDFAGVLVEYAYVNTTTSAISKGQKTLMLAGANLAAGAVFATDFLADSDETAGKLSFISAAQGLGSSDNSRIVIAIDGQPDINKLSAAPEWLSGGNYYFNTASALTGIFKNQLEVGDAFAAYFPTTKHYALFKINSIAADRIVVDYIVNASEDERLFK
ncbi:MAG: hypothetical protein GQF41_1020 [Candidatus Rifleibacterium amylolyticum]|nr:MAG: hypothetical protein GQF41_1020 [Candidatus Rifleibacterium amylolyticum]